MTEQEETHSEAFNNFLKRYSSKESGKMAGEFVLNYGKHKGKTFSEIYESDKPYVVWFVSQPESKYNKRASKYFRERIENEYLGDV